MPLLGIGLLITAGSRFANPRPFLTKNGLRKKYLTNRITRLPAQFLTAPNGPYATLL